MKARFQGPPAAVAAATLEGAIFDLDTCCKALFALAHLKEQIEDPENFFRLFALQLHGIHADLESVRDAWPALARPAA